MDLALDDIQDLIQENARRFLETEFGSASVREAEAGEDGFPASLWSQMSELGWTGLALPEDLGGGGRGIADLCVLAEELGRAAASTPLVASAGLAACLLQAVGRTPATDRMLGAMATDGAVTVAALIEPGGRNERTMPATELAAVGEGFTLTGEKILVPYMSVATDIVVSAKTGQGELALVAVDREAGGITWSRHKSVSGEPLYSVRFAEVAIAGDRVLAHGAPARAALAAGLDRAAVLSSAEAVGMCEGILRLTTAHAGLRRQFGKAIGSFQAVSHPCADMRIQTDACRLLVHQAAWLLDQGRPAQLEVASTKAYVNEAAARIAHDGHRLHGAIGYSKEYDLQLYSRKIRAFCLTLGGTDDQLDSAATALGL